MIMKYHKSLKSQTFCWFLWATDQAPEVLKMLSEAAATKRTANDIKIRWK